MAFFIGRRTLKELNKEDIEFESEKWVESFHRYKMMASSNKYLRDRMVFVEVWIKIMQLEMRGGILDPDTTFQKAKKVSGVYPSIEDIYFMRGFIISHWKYGLDFLSMNSFRAHDNLVPVVEDMKRRYYFSEEEYHMRHDETIELKKHFY